MAEFCTVTKMSPSEYKKLTLGEYTAFIEVLNSQGGSTNIEDVL